MGNFFFEVTLSYRLPVAKRRSLQRAPEDV
jgi:hypothetical protein